MVIAFLIINSITSADWAPCCGSPCSPLEAFAIPWNQQLIKAVKVKDKKANSFFSFSKVPIFWFFKNTFSLLSLWESLLNGWNLNPPSVVPLPQKLPSTGKSAGVSQPSSQLSSTFKGKEGQILLKVLVLLYRKWIKLLLLLHLSQSIKNLKYNTFNIII